MYVAAAAAAATAHIHVPRDLVQTKPKTASTRKILYLLPTLL